MMEKLSVFKDVNHPIVERCKKGENAAFRELYDLYAKSMFNTAMRIVNNYEDAQEVLQDSFMKAFENIHRFDSKFSFGVWLKRIVINQSLDNLKKKKVTIVSIDSEHNYINEPEESEDDSIYSVDTIKACISKLPDGYRTILSLVLFEDCTHKEVSSLLKISEGTSKSQYHRAKKSLVELLTQNATTANDR